MRDHLAGSTSALELLDHLISLHAGTALEPFFTELRQEIDQDRAALRDLVRKLGSDQSLVRNTAAWFAEKGARVKLRFEDQAGGPLARLEMLEALALGIEGKRSLWRALATVSDAVPALGSVDLGWLEQRAAQQRERVEVRRLEAAREAFRPAP